MISDALSIGGIVAVMAGGGLVVGATIAIIGKEIATGGDDSIIDKAETSIIRIGYVTEGVAKGTLIAAPVSLFALIAVNYGLKVQKKVVGGV